MTDKEFIEKKCEKCINKNNEEDLCNIMKNTAGEPQCVNFQIKKDI